MILPKSVIDKVLFDFSLVVSNDAGLLGTRALKVSRYLSSVKSKELISLNTNVLRLSSSFVSAILNKYESDAGKGCRSYWSLTGYWPGSGSSFSR